MKTNIYQKDGLVFVEVSNKNGLTVTLCNLGASIYSITKNKDYLILTPREVSTFKKSFIYHGKTIGRVANRIDKGEIVINNKTYILDLNEKTKTLHGGKEGFSNQLFEYQVNESKEGIEIEFHYYSKDLEGGFPGDLHTRVKYYIYNNKDEINLSFEASSSKDTLLALTNHSYFTLGSKSLNDLSLRIDADKYVVPNPKDLIPLKEEKVNNVMDFRSEKKINQDINDASIKNGLLSGYDHHYIFNKVNGPQITLKNNKYKLDIYTNFTGTQIYTDNGKDDIKWMNTSRKTRRAIAIEPQDNILDRKILKANEVYKRFIRYCFN